MSTTIKESKSIPENPPRWKPSSDPASITVAGLDTTASVTDQIDQIDQLITLKLQVSYACQLFVFIQSFLPYFRISMQTFPRCNKFFRTESCLLSNDTRSVLSRRAKQPRYDMRVYSRRLLHITFFPSSGRPFTSRPPRSVFRHPMTSLYCKRLLPAWP